MLNINTLKIYYFIICESVAFLNISEWAQLLTDKFTRNKPKGEAIIKNLVFYNIKRGKFRSYNYDMIQLKSCHKK